MHIPSNKILKSNAVSRLNASENHRHVVLIYTAIITGMAALVTIVNYCLGLQIDQMGGLSNMGTKSLLSTIQSVLPMINTFVAMCLEIGFLAAMVRVTRGQYTSPQTLRLGFERFGLLLRASLLQFFIYAGACLIAVWVATQIYMISPFAQPALELVTPYAVEGVNTMELMMDDALVMQLMEAMIPMYVIFGVLYLALILPISYSFRMVNYLIIDKPGARAMALLSESRAMMRGHRMRLFKLDLSLWWWFILSVLVSVIAYGDVLLPMVGISLPGSETFQYFLFYFLFLTAQFAMTVFLRSRVEVTYAQVYEKLRPREQTGGVAIGNIFQM